MLAPIGACNSNHAGERSSLFPERRLTDRRGRNERQVELRVDRMARDQILHAGLRALDRGRWQIGRATISRDRNSCK